VLKNLRFTELLPMMPPMLLYLPVTAGAPSRSEIDATIYVAAKIRGIVLMNLMS